MTGQLGARLRAQRRQRMAHYLRVLVDLNVRPRTLRPAVGPKCYSSYLSISIYASGCASNLAIRGLRRRLVDGTRLSLISARLRLVRWYLAAQVLKPLVRM